MEKHYSKNLPPVINYFQGKDRYNLICWPVYAYKIIAPQPNEGKTNLFQKLILQLAQIGYWETSIIVEITKLDERLIIYIKRQLFAKGLLTEIGELTEEGKKAINEQNYFLDELKTGYIFQDPYSYTVLNQFSQNLQFADIEKVENKKERVFIDENDSKYVYWVNRNNLPQHIKPNAYEIISALTNYSKLTRNFEIGEKDNIYLDNYAGQIHFVDESPELFYLLIEARENKNENDWTILNPFGFEVYDEKIDTLVRLRLAQDKNLSTYLNKFINPRKPHKNTSPSDIEKTSPVEEPSEEGETPVPNEEIDYAKIASEAEDKFREEVIRELVENYGNIKNTKLFPAYLEYSVLEKQVEKIEDFENINIIDKWQQLVLRASNVQAEFIRELLSVYDFATIIPINEFDDDIDERRKNFKMMLKMIGYKYNLPNDILLKYCSKREFTSKIRNIHKENEKPLLTMFILSVASGLYSEFADVIKNNQPIIENMLNIFNVRNRKSIAHTNSLVPSKKDLQVIKTTIKTLTEFYYTVYSRNI